MTRDPLLFDAILRPHRSLSPAGFWALMIFVSLVSFGTGAAYALSGAWPVLGFYGLDVLAIWAAFKWSYRSGRLFETVRLTPASLEVRRVHPSGRWEHWRFQPYWVRLSVESGDDPRINLAERSVSVDLGAFMSAHERLDFARALQCALTIARQPA